MRVGQTHPRLGQGYAAGAGLGHPGQNAGWAVQNLRPGGPCRAVRAVLQDLQHLLAGVHHIVSAKRRQKPACVGPAKNRRPCGGQGRQKIFRAVRAA